MHSLKKLIVGTSSLGLLLVLNSLGMSSRGKSAAVGAGIGGFAGTALGSGALATVAGAAIGGLVGNQIGK